MTTVLEILMAPFFAIIDFVLAAPASAIVAAACVVGVVVAMLVTVACRCPRLGPQRALAHRTARLGNRPAERR
jgi:hypothetical protein